MASPEAKWEMEVDGRLLEIKQQYRPTNSRLPTIAKLIMTIQEQCHPIMATIDVKDMFFMVPLQPEDQERFAFTWEGQQYTFTRLPQGYKHSPTLAHHALAQELETVPIGAGVRIYQYIDDLLVGGSQIEEVGEAKRDIIAHLEIIGLTIPPEKMQAPSSEVKFLGIWRRGGMTCIPPDTLSSLDLIRMPESKKDLQHALGLLVFWRKHIPDFSIIARPLYNLLRKKAQWEWTPVHDEALGLLIFEANAYQALGPIHPIDPIQIEWGFARTGLSIHLWQKGPEGPIQPIGFYLRSFKDAEKRYTTWEKGLFVVSLALREAKRTIRKQPITLRGLFKVTKAVLAGTQPPDGVAQRASV
ncbi:pol-like protein ENS-3 [Grus japonensis]|uniref:ribonuclease H n=1 Tax=Grus japonensis TaxID=30415 RepID=A0ABC9W577_GRUJA